MFKLLLLVEIILVLSLSSFAFAEEINDPNILYDIAKKELKDNNYKAAETFFNKSIERGLSGKKLDDAYSNLSLVYKKLPPREDIEGRITADARRIVVEIKGKSDDKINMAETMDVMISRIVTQGGGGRYGIYPIVDTARFIFDIDPFSDEQLSPLLKSTDSEMFVVLALYSFSGPSFFKFSGGGALLEVQLIGKSVPDKVFSSIIDNTSVHIQKSSTNHNVFYVWMERAFLRNVKNNSNSILKFFRGVLAGQDKHYIVQRLDILQPRFNEHVLVN